MKMKVMHTKDLVIIDQAGKKKNCRIGKGRRRVIEEINAEVNGIIDTLPAMTTKTYEKTDGAKMIQLKVKTVLIT